MDVFTAIGDHGAADDVGVVARLGEVVSSLEAARLTGGETDGLVLVVPRGRRDDGEQLPLLGGQAEADPGAELAEGPPGDPQVEARPVRAVAGRGSVLAGVAEAVFLSRSLVDPAGDAERGQQLLDAAQQLLGTAAEAHIAGPVLLAHGAA